MYEVQRSHLQITWYEIYIMVNYTAQNNLWYNILELESRCPPNYQEYKITKHPFQSSIV